MSGADNKLALLQQVMSCHQPLQLSGDYPEAAVLVAVSDNVNNPELLLTRRAEHLAIHSGEVAFPGGKRDPQDPSLLHTALREAEEEVALPASDFTPAGCLSQRVTRSGIIVTPYVGLIPCALDLRANEDEIESLFYTPLDFFLDPQNLHVESVKYQGEWRNIPRFNYRHYTIWGVTAMIIVDLMNTVFAADLSLENEQ